MDRQKMVAELTKEINALTRARDALTSVGDGATGERTRNVSTEGVGVISASAKLRWARERLQKSPKDEGLKAEVSKLEKELADARKAMDARKKSKK
jgi:uncharacterized protein YlxW (UPF0749 family)